MIDIEFEDSQVLARDNRLQIKDQDICDIRTGLMCGQDEKCKAESEASLLKEAVHQVVQSECPFVEIVDDEGEVIKIIGSTEALVAYIYR